MSAQHIGPPAQGDPGIAAAEQSVRRMIANGRSKLALDNAKELHKKHHTAGTEALLVEAYVARIRQLGEQKLEQEAKSLWQIVCDRYPAAAKAIGDPFAAVPGLAHKLEETVRPMADPSIGAEQRDEIESWLRVNLIDPADLAACPSLPADHSLRIAAAAVSRALVAVTSGEVTAEQIALPEVSRRSPLAPWKSLIQAIAAFYNHEDSDCGRCLDAIPSDSAPARSARPLREMMAGARPLPSAKQATPADKLIGLVVPDRSALRRELVELEELFQDQALESQKSKAVRKVVEETEKSAPRLAPRLKQHISVRWIVEGADANRVMSVLRGCKEDAYYFRLLARGLETVGYPGSNIAACGAWEHFRQNAIKESWFPAKSPEAAAVYLQMATVICRVPPYVLATHRHSGPRLGSEEQMAQQAMFYLWPERIFELAVAADPDGKAWAAWLDWGRLQYKWTAERVAEQWHAYRPGALEPLLYLITVSERRGALQKAAGYLDKAEKIESVHPLVRQGRLRLLMKKAVKHIEQGKLHLLRKDLAQIDELPQARQGDKAVAVTGLRLFAARLEGNEQTQSGILSSLEKSLGSKAAAALVLSGLVAKGTQRFPLPLLKDLTNEEKDALPVSIARACSLDLGLDYRLILPAPWMNVALAAYRSKRPQLDARQLEALGTAALDAYMFGFAFLVSTDGLKLGGSTEARFLLMRGKLLGRWDPHRGDCCLRAAVALARRTGDARLVEEVLEEADDPEDLSKITPELLEAVREQERADEAFPPVGGGPDYRKLDPSWGAGDFRGPWDEDDDEDDDFFDEDDFDDDVDEFPPLPLDPAKFSMPGVPKGTLPKLLEEARKAMARGQSLEDFLSSKLMPGGKPKKGHEYF